MTVDGDAIEPDGKDWTWVLQRPCPDCGFDASAIRREDVLDHIRRDGVVWVDWLGSADVGVRLVLIVWSVLEYGCHVRDVHRIFEHRVQLMLTEDDPLFPNWDQDETAIEDRYDQQDPAVVAVELGDAGEQIASHFAAVHGEQWLRTGTRSDGARFTVDSFSRYLVHDLVHHIYDVG